MIGKQSALPRKYYDDFNDRTQHLRTLRKCRKDFPDGKIKLLSRFSKYKDIIPTLKIMFNDFTINNTVSALLTTMKVFMITNHCGLKMMPPIYR